MADNKCYCCLCKSEVNPDGANILAMGRYGTPRYLCESCSEKMDAATSAKCYDEAAGAIEALGALLVKAGADDVIVEQSLTPILNAAAERASKIKSGEYDFALDEEKEEELLDVPEELLEVEEDRILDEADEKKQKKLDKYMNIALLVITALAVAAFIIFRIIR